MRDDDIEVAHPLKVFLEDNGARKMFKWYSSSIVEDN